MLLIRWFGENSDLNIERAENMEAKSIQDIFIKILRSELTETELDDSVKEQLTSDVVAALYSLSDRHDLAHIVFSALYKCGLKMTMQFIPNLTKKLLCRFTEMSK